MKKMVAVLGGLVMGSCLAKDLKIGVVNTQEVIFKSNIVKKYRDDSEKKFKPQQEALKAQQEALKGLTDKLKKDAANMKNEELEEMQLKIVDLRLNIKRKVEDLGKEVKIEDAKIFKAVTKKMGNIIDSLINKGEYDIISDKQSFLGSSKKLDITNKILNDINK
jgi:outer membrane protein